MAGAEGEPRPTSRERRPTRVAYTDAEGRATHDPTTAVQGEIVEYGDHDELRRRTRFFLAERELPWLSVSEPAFLLWALAALMVVWLVIGLILRLT